MTNAKVYQGFHDDKKVEEHCSRVNLNAVPVGVRYGRQEVNVYAF